MKFRALYCVLLSSAAAHAQDNAISGEFDQLEWRSRGVALWDAEVYLGNPADKAVVFKTSGAALNNDEEGHEAQLLGQFALNDYWALRGGIRHDHFPDPQRTWGVLSLVGEDDRDNAFEITGFVKDGNQSLLLGIEHFYEITPKLKLIPKAEAVFNANDDPEIATGDGLTAVELSIRLRYIVNPKFKPYVGVQWINSYGSTRTLLEEEGSPSQRFVGRLGFTFAF